MFSDVKKAMREVAWRLLDVGAVLLQPPAAPLRLLQSCLHFALLQWWLVQWYLPGLSKNGLRKSAGIPLYLVLVQYVPYSPLAVHLPQSPLGRGWNFWGFRSPKELLYLDTKGLGQLAKGRRPRLMASRLYAG